jgi:hypothetical protein
MAGRRIAFKFQASIFDDPISEYFEELLATPKYLFIVPTFAKFHVCSLCPDVFGATILGILI